MTRLCVNSVEYIECFVHRHYCPMPRDANIVYYKDVDGQADGPTDRPVAISV